MKKTKKLSALGISILFWLWLLAPWTATGEEISSNPLSLKQTILAQALVEQNPHAVRIELTKMLQDPAEEFSQKIKAVHQQDYQDIFYLVKALESIRSQLDLTEQDFSQIVEDITNTLILLLPPLKKQNKAGLTAEDIGKLQGNQAFLQWFRSHKVIASNYEFYEDKSLPEEVIRLLPHVNLEKTALIQALSAEDPKLFLKEIADLKKGPIAHLLGVLHSRSSRGDTIYTLVAKAKTHQQEFVQGLDDLTQFILPPSALRLKTLKAPLKLSEVRFLKKQQALFTQGAIYVLLSLAGLYITFNQSTETSLPIGMISGITLGIGVSQCQTAFRNIKHGIVRPRHRSHTDKET